VLTIAQRGFTIIELLVGLTLLAVLIGLGAPAMSSYLQTSKLQSVAASYYSLGGNVRCRRITVSPGGQISSCDPAAPAGDSRAC